MLRASSSRTLLALLALSLACDEPVGPPNRTLEVSPSSLTLTFLGETDALTATLRNDDGTAAAGESLTWTSSNGTVASVSTGGLVTAVANGSATMTATSGSLSRTVPVTVAQAAAAVTLSIDSIQLEGVGDQETLTPTVTDAGGANIATAWLSWSSADPGVASVASDGIVEGVASGATSITAEAEAGGSSVTGSWPVSVGEGVAADPVGGELTLADSAVKVTVPAGAVSEAVFLSAAPAAALPSSPVPIPGTAFDMGPGGIVFAQPVTLRISYEPLVLPGGVPESELRLHKLVGGVFVPLAVSTVDVDANSVAGEVGGFSTFAILRLIEITTPGLPGGFVGTPYAPADLEAAGGAEGGSWTVEDGSPPPGLELSASGQIAGTPSEGGSWTFTVRLTAEDGRVASRTFTVSVSVPLGVLTTELPAAVPGVPYEATLAAAGGGGDYTWTVTVGSLPTGLSLATNGTITGTPSGTSATFTVEVTSGDGQSDQKELTLDLNPPLEITTVSLPDGVLGVPYGPESLAASDGDDPLGWAITEGALPAGLGLSADGAISGTPETAGASDFTVGVTSGDGQSATADLSITINESVPTSVQLQIGDDQVGYPGAGLPLDVEVRVLDDDLEGVAGVEVAFSTGDGGALDPSVGITGANGVAGATWTVGSDPPPASPGWRVERAVARVDALEGDSIVFEAEVNRDPGGSVSVYRFGEQGFYGFSDDPFDFREGGGFDPIAANNLVELNGAPVTIDEVIIVSQAPISGLVSEGGLRFIVPTDACSPGTPVDELIDIPIRVEVRGRVTMDTIQAELTAPELCTGS